MSSTHEELELVKQNAIEKHSGKFDLLKSKNFKIDSNYRFFFNDDEERNVKANMKIEPIEFKGMISVGYPRPQLKLNVFLSDLSVNGKDIDLDEMLESIMKSFTEKERGGILKMLLPNIENILRQEIQSIFKFIGMDGVGVIINNIDTK